MLPVLFQSGPLVVYTHDLFTALGLLAGLAVYYRALRRDRMLEPLIVLFSVIGYVGGGIGVCAINEW